MNNAGIVVLATIEETTLAQWRAVQAVNSDGVFLGCKHALPALAQSGGGSIVNLSSAAALVGTPAFAAYSASKGAVRSLTKTVAVHCALRGWAIRCNSIHPGGIDTPMLQSLGALRRTPRRSRSSCSRSRRPGVSASRRTWPSSCSTWSRTPRA